MSIARTVHTHARAEASVERRNDTLLAPGRILLLAVTQFFVSLWFSYAAARGPVTLASVVVLGCVPIILTWTALTAWSLVRR